MTLKNLVKKTNSQSEFCYKSNFHNSQWTGVGLKCLAHQFLTLANNLFLLPLTARGKRDLTPFALENSSVFFCGRCVVVVVVVVVVVYIIVMLLSLLSLLLS